MKIREAKRGRGGLRSAPAVVTVGDELIFGERADENGRWMLELLWRRGCPARVALSLPDNVEVIAGWLKRLLDDGLDPVLAAGGIGGTHDDCTREGIARALNVPLALHEECFRLLRARYGGELNEERQRMAWLPRGSRLIANPSGAPGFRWGPVLAFPGFPRMLRPMLRACMDEILPPERGGEWIVREHVVEGLEGDMARSVESFSARFPDLRVGVYPAAEEGKKEVILRLRCRADDEEALVAFRTLAENLRKTLKGGNHGADPGGSG